MVNIPHLGLPTVEELTGYLDEDALYFLWYARARREQGLQPLRVVALPAELLQKRWAIELNDLLERRVFSYEDFLKEDDEKETTDCPAIVLHRPVYRALRFWDTWVLPVIPIITTLGIVWTSSRRR